MYIESSGKTKKFKGNSKDKDCLTKKLILETISIDPLTAKEIFERSGYTGTYKTLTGVIGRYQKYGYITREGNIPYHYFLTDLGFQHLENPYLGREAAVRDYKARMMSSLVKYAGDFDDETLTELFKDRVVTPTVQNNVTEKVIQNKEPAIKILSPSEGIADKTDTNTSEVDNNLIAKLSDRVKELEDFEALYHSTKAELDAQQTKDANISLNNAVKTPEFKPLEARYFDQDLINYRNKPIPGNFFDLVPYRLLREKSVNVNKATKVVVAVCLIFCKIYSLPLTLLF
ncbi:MAG: hypothetical protein PHT13_08565 [Methanosarcina sp.]|nr:hypothetical protein [Methanosarcina sp.]